MNVRGMPFRCAILGLLAGAPLLAEDAGKPVAPADSAKVDEAVAKGAAWLMTLVKEGFPPFEFGQSEFTGLTYNELVLCALLHAGVPRNDPAVINLVRSTRATPLTRTYGASLRALAFEKFDAALLRADLLQCAQFLLDNQGKNGYWGYSKEIPLPALPSVNLGSVKAAVPGPAGPVRKVVVARRSWGEQSDNCNTQYALVGLAACMASGISPPTDTFPLAEKWLTACQNDDGGWCYMARAAPGKDSEASYGSMTAACISSLSLCLRARNKDPLKDARVQKGIAWLGKKLTFDTNPGRPGWQYDWYVAIERAGAFSGTPTFGERDWYAEGSAWLVAHQQGDGSWSVGEKPFVLRNTCMAVLFLRNVSRSYADRLKQSGP